jgi:hypothetical protein
VKRTLTTKLALAGGVAALALGAAACEVDDGTDTTVEDPVLDDGTQDDTLQDDTLQDDTMDDGTMEDDTLDDEG